jgi:hypothetical protein
MNFLSEGNSITSGIESEKETENYYTKKSEKIDTNTNTNTESINYFYLEINKKNKQITELKSIISNLKKAQDKLINENKLLQKNNHPFSKDSYSKDQKQFLISKIKSLQSENSTLKRRINNSEEKDNIFYKNINNKLLKAERDIKILSFENKNNNNILLAIQNFLFNITEKFYSKNQNLIFDLSLVDNNTFIRNLQILEANIINNLNQLNNIGNICLCNNHSRNKSIKTIDDINYNKNNHINIISNDDKKMKNIKRILKHKKSLKSFNYLNLNDELNKRNKKYMSYGCLYSNYYEGENQKNDKPMKAYYLKNNYNREISLNDDICYDNKTQKINNYLNSYKNSELYKKDEFQE